LRYIDWDIVRNNPKIFCGYSDITVLNNAIYAKTGLVNYNGPHYSSFGQKLYFDYTLEYFRKTLLSDEPYEVIPSHMWSDDMWYMNQDKRELVENPGFFVINRGEANGTIVGGNINTLNLLQGTEYFPSLKDSVLFIEDDEGTAPHIFDRDLQSLIHTPDFEGVRGIVIGRFQKNSKISNELLVKIIKTKKELDGLPVIANVDFGHTDPKLTIPVGGEVILKVKDEVKLEINRH
jgi:muramoyltetrapeptide carboxypeptidase LdcA involved in peptidoglycan recycling